MIKESDVIKLCDYLESDRTRIWEEKGRPQNDGYINGEHSGYCHACQDIRSWMKSMERYSQRNVFKLRISRQYLRSMINLRGFCVNPIQMIWINDSNRPCYLKIEACQLSDAFCKKWVYKISYFSMVTKYTRHFGNITSLNNWLYPRFGIVSVP